MKISLKPPNQTPVPALTELIREQLAGLGKLGRIDEAYLVVERLLDASLAPIFNPGIGNYMGPRKWLECE